MEAPSCSTETSFNFQRNTQRHISEDKTFRDIIKKKEGKKGIKNDRNKERVNEQRKYITRPKTGKQNKGQKNKRKKERKATS
jgi:hypothetical protein